MMGTFKKNKEMKTESGTNAPLGHLYLGNQ